VGIYRCAGCGHPAFGQGCHISVAQPQNLGGDKRL